MMIGWCAGDDRDDGQTSARRRHPSGDHWPWFDIVVVVSPSGREEAEQEKYGWNVVGEIQEKTIFFLQEQER